MIPLDQLIHLEGVVNVPGRGIVYVGRLLAHHAPDSLVNLRVLLNDIPMRIIAVERFAVLDPYRAGAKVGLRLLQC